MLMLVVGSTNGSVSQVHIGSHLFTLVSQVHIGGHTVEFTPSSSSSVSESLNVKNLGWLWMKSPRWGWLSMAVPCRLTTRVPLWARREGPSCSPWYDLSLLPSCKSGCLHLFLQVKWGPVYTLYSDYNVVILYDGTFVEVNTSSAQGLSSPKRWSGDPGAVGERPTLRCLRQLRRQHQERDARQGGQLGEHDDHNLKW